MADTPLPDMRLPQKKSVHKSADSISSPHGQGATRYDLMSEEWRFVESR